MRDRCRPSRAFTRRIRSTDASSCSWLISPDSTAALIPLNAASSSGECRTKSTPAFTAITAALSGVQFFEMAYIDIESVKISPSNFISPRSSPVRIGRLSVAGTAGRRVERRQDDVRGHDDVDAGVDHRAEGRQLHLVEVLARVRDRRQARGACPRSVSPWPGKCFAVDSTPAAWMPLM